MATGCSERAWIEHTITVLGCNFMKVVNGPRVGGRDVIKCDRCDIVRETRTDTASHSSPLWVGAGQERIPPLTVHLYEWARGKKTERTRHKYTV